MKFVMLIGESEQLIFFITEYDMGLDKWAFVFHLAMSCRLCE